MRYPQILFVSVLIRLVAAVLLLTGVGSVPAAPIEPAADAPRPHPPEESIRRMRATLETPSALKQSN